MRLVRADGALHDRILDETFPLWHDGLSRERYGVYNAAQMLDAVGRAAPRAARARRRRRPSPRERQALPAARWWSTAPHVPTLGIGAVFTPPADRGRGYARALIEHLIDVAAAEGAGAALLFSEIGHRLLREDRVRAGAAHRRRADDRAAAGRAGDDRALGRAAGPAATSSSSTTRWPRATACRFAGTPTGSPTGSRRSGCSRRSRPGPGASSSASSRKRAVAPVAWVLLQVSGRDRRGLPRGLEPRGLRRPRSLRRARRRAAPGAGRAATRRRRRRSSAAGGRRGCSRRRSPSTRRTSSPITMMIRPARRTASHPGSLGARDVLYWHGDAF